MQREQDIQEYAQAKGKQLGALIATSRLNDKQKELWIALLPTLSLTQLDRLINVLENDLYDMGFSDLDEDLRNSITEAEDEFDNEQRAADTKALQQLKELTHGL